MRGMLDNRVPLPGSPVVPLSNRGTGEPVVETGEPRQDWQFCATSPGDEPFQVPLSYQVGTQAAAALAGVSVKAIRKAIEAERLTAESVVIEDGRRKGRSEYRVQMGSLFAAYPQARARWEAQQAAAKAAAASAPKPTRDAVQVALRANPEALERAATVQRARMALMEQARAFLANATLSARNRTKVGLPECTLVALQSWYMGEDPRAADLRKVLGATCPMGEVRAKLIKHPQIWSRIATVVEFGPITLDDVHAAAKTLLDGVVLQRSNPGKQPTDFLLGAVQAGLEHRVVGRARPALPRRELVELRLGQAAGEVRGREPGHGLGQHAAVAGSQVIAGDLHLVGGRDRHHGSAGDAALGILPELRGVLQGMLTRAGDLRVPFTAIGPLMVSSSVKNFQVGGRPTPWAPNAPSTARKKAKAGRTKVLVWSGALYRSIIFTVGARTLTWGTNLPYGRIQQEGGTITHPGGEGKVRLRTNARGELMRNARGGSIFAKGSHKRAVERAFTHGAYPISIPARPFLVIQPEDRALAQAIIARWISDGRV